MADHSVPGLPTGPRERSENEVGPCVSSRPVSESALHMLQASVLSLDWEISDETVSVFLQAVQRLQQELAQDPVTRKFTLLLGALGKYIQQSKSASHPESIRLLHVAYNSLEQVLENTGLDDAARRNLLLDRMTDYQKLRDMLSVHTASGSKGSVPDASRKSGDSPEPTRRSEHSQPLSGTRTDFSGSSGIERGPREVPAEYQDLVMQAVEEIKRTIQSEFQALRAEIRLLQAGK